MKKPTWVRKLFLAGILVWNLMPVMSGYAASGSDIDFVPEEVTKIFIPVTVNSIEEDVFVPFSALTDVYYEGTREQWRKVQIAKQSAVKTEDGWQIPAFHNADFHFNADASSADTNFEEYIAYCSQMDSDTEDTEDVVIENTYRTEIEKVLKSVIDGSHPDSKIGDTGSKYWSWYYGRASSQSDSWCAVYASWLLGQVGNSAIKASSTNTQIAILSSAGSYRDSSYVPKTGDLIFFSEGGRTASHVGMVVIDDGATYILHGNYSKKVSYNRLDAIWIKSSRRRFCDSILGYGDMEHYTAGDAEIDISSSGC